MENQNEIAERLSAILSDPEGLQQIKNMAAGLFGGNMTPSESEPKPATEESPFGDIDIASLARIAGMFKSKSEDNEKTRLLLALKPHLSSARQKKVDTAVKILKLLDLAPMLNELGLFKL